jgi:hypothetical protein
LFVVLSALITIGMDIYVAVGEPGAEIRDQVFTWGLGIMLFGAFGLCFWGVAWLLGRAFRQDLSEGLLCLLIPLYAVYFAARRWEERRGAFVLTLAPLAWLAVSGAIAFVGGYVKGTAKGMIRDADRAAASRALGQPSNGPAAPNLNGSPPAAPRTVAVSARKADAYQVRMGEEIVRREIQLIDGIAGQLASIHDGFSANRVAHSLRITSMFARGAFRGAGDIDLGSNEITALKHRIGQDVIRALNQLKAQAARVQSIPGLQGFIKPDAISRIDNLIAQWTLKPGEETMPELVEPPPDSHPFGPRGRFVGMPPGWRGPLGPGMPPMGAPPSIEALIDQYRQDLRRTHGDRMVAVRVTGVKHGGDPSASEVTEAIQKRIKELSTGITAFHAATINDQFATVVAPVDDIQGLASGIDFGTVTVKDATIEVQLDDRWAANVPRKPKESQPKPEAAPLGERPRPEDSDIPPGADAITRSLIELKSSDPGKRKGAIQRLQRSVPDGRVDQVVEALLPMLEDDDGFLVTDVVRALAFWRSPEAMQGLIGRLRDNRPFVRGEAIKALGRYREPRAAEAIVGVMKEDGFAVEDALKSMGGDVAEPALLPVLRSPDSGLRGHACRILAEIGGQKTLQEMQSLPTDPDFGVRVAAQDAWKKIVARVGPLPRPARGKAGTTGR